MMHFCILGVEMLNSILTSVDVYVAVIASASSQVESEYELQNRRFVS